MHEQHLPFVHATLALLSSVRTLFTSVSTVTRTAEPAWPSAMQVRCHQIAHQDPPRTHALATRRGTGSHPRPIASTSGRLAASRQSRLQR